MSDPTDQSQLSDPARLKAVEDTGLLNSGREPDFDQLTRLAAQLLGTPGALVTVISHDRQFVKSASDGIPDTYAAGTSQPLEMSFCKYAVASKQPLIIENAHDHPLVKNSMAIDAGVVAYAGIPLESHSGEAIGALCVVDSKPREWSELDIANLRALARSAMKLIDERPSSAGDASGPVGESLLGCVEVHLRAVDDYARIVRSSRELDFTQEAQARAELVRTLDGLRKEFEEGSSAKPDLHEAVARYLEADESRGAATRQFAAGEIDLSLLESAIRRHMDSSDNLRVTALSHGVDL